MKLTTNRFHEFDIRRTKPPQNTTAAVLTHGDYSQRVQTACHFGGCRYWFVCPSCCGRVGVLYLISNGLACRKCLHLAYPTENKPKRLRAVVSGFKVRHRLKWQGGYIGDGGAGKPKGMRWKTFKELVARHEKYAKVYWRD